MTPVTHPSPDGARPGFRVVSNPFLERRARARVLRSGHLFVLSVYSFENRSCSSSTFSFFIFQSSTKRFKSEIPRVSHVRRGRLWESTEVVRLHCPLTSRASFLLLTAGAPGHLSVRPGKQGVRGLHLTEPPAPREAGPSLPPWEGPDGGTHTERRAGPSGVADGHSGCGPLGHPTARSVTLGAAEASECHTSSAPRACSHARLSLDGFGLIAFLNGDDC